MNTEPRCTRVCTHVCVRVYACTYSLQQVLTQCLSSSDNLWFGVTDIDVHGLKGLSPRCWLNAA